MTARCKRHSPAELSALITAGKPLCSKPRTRTPRKPRNTANNTVPMPLPNTGRSGIPPIRASLAPTELHRRPHVHGGLAVHAVRHDGHQPQRLVVLHPHRAPLPPAAPGAAAAHGHQHPVRARAALRVQRADAHLARQPHPQPPPRAHRQRPLPRRRRRRRSGAAATAAGDGRRPPPARGSHSQGRPARGQRRHCRRRGGSARDRADGTRPLRAGGSPWRPAGHVARLHAGSGTGTAGKQAVAAPRSLLGVVVLQRAEGTTAGPEGLSESGEGGALARVCCYWAILRGVRANQERGRLRRAGGGARVAIATGTPLGRAGTRWAGRDWGHRGRDRERQSPCSDIEAGSESSGAATARVEESLRAGSATPARGPGRCCEETR